MDVAGFIAMALVGVTLGIMGAGGSILTVPIMVYFFHFEPGQATGYSLGVVGMTAAIALRIYWYQGKVLPMIALRFFPASVLGVIAARKLLLPQIPDPFLRTNWLTLSKDALIMCVFASVMVLAARSMIMRKSPELSKVSGKNPVREIVSAFTVGMVTGFVGAGGGFLIIPTLVTLMGLAMPEAVGTSLLIIAMNSLSGFLSVIWSDHSVPWVQIIGMALIASVAAIISARWSGRIPQSKLQTAFGWFMLIMGFGIIAQQLG